MDAAEGRGLLDAGGTFAVLPNAVDALISISTSIRRREAA